jgi:hypothetical protein
MEQSKLPDIKPLSEEEISDLIKKIEESGDTDSELARAMFTILVVGFEYQQLYTTLQAYYAAGSGACYYTAQEAVKVIGLRDRAKIKKIYEVAATAAGYIPERALNIINQQQANDTTTDNDNTEVDNNVEETETETK